MHEHSNQRSRDLASYLAPLAPFHIRHTDTHRHLLCTSHGQPLHQSRCMAAQHCSLPYAGVYGSVCMIASADDGTKSVGRGAAIGMLYAAGSASESYMCDQSWWLSSVCAFSQPGDAATAGSCCLRCSRGCWSATGSRPSRIRASGAARASFGVSSWPSSHTRRQHSHTTCRTLPLLHLSCPVQPPA